jgi:hypothetical protein
VGCARHGPSLSDCQTTGQQDCPRSAGVHCSTDSDRPSCGLPPESAQNRIAGLPQEADLPDEFIALEEGAPFYGPVLQSLTPFPTANEGGVVTYTQSFRVDGDLTDLSDEVVVLHGRHLDGTCAMTLPVACGQIPSSP